MELTKYDPLTPEVIKAFEKEGIEDLKVGDIFIKDERDEVIVFKIVKFEITKEYGVYVHIHTAMNTEGTEWDSNRHYSDGEKFDDRYSVHDFKEYYIKRSIKLPGEKTVKEFYEEALDLITGKTSPTIYEDHTSDKVNTETGLIHKNSKEALLIIQKDLEEKRKYAELVHAFVGLEMARKRQELEKIREAMYGVLAEFNKKIKKIMRVITTIELYLGIDEELFQIQEGPAASENVPITFRQGLLYMDEEIGHWKGGGLDYNDIKWFDEWLIKDNNFKKCFPEQKGVIVFRPRRERKDYGGNDWYSNAQKNTNNLNTTYLLIRNGENLYRIYTNKIVITPRLFPKKKELEELLQLLEKETKGSYSSEKMEEQIEDTAYQYRKRAVLLQGLIDRSDMFKPMTTRVNIFNMDATPGMVNFIYDDEDTLPSGRLTFHQWWKKLDEGIKIGSRVLVTGHYNNSRGSWSRSEFSDRFYNRGENNIPDLPNEGVYEVEAFYPGSAINCRKSVYDEYMQKWPDGRIIRTEEEKLKMYGECPDQTWKLIKIKKDHYKYGKVEGVSELVPYKGDMDCYFIVFRNIEPHMTITYQPGGNARTGWNDWDDRKNKVRFRIYPDDGFLMNYDQLDLKDVEFYLNSRVDRPNYLDMMPLLLKIKAERLKEFAQEKEFIKFIIARNIDSIPGCTENDVRKRVIVSLVWYKYKNKYKRPITQDDTLALRMIEKRINSKNYDKLKSLDE